MVYAVTIETTNRRNRGETKKGNPSMGPVSSGGPNPIVKKGLYRVSYRGVTKKYRGVSVSEAMWKLAQFMKMDYYKILWDIETEEIEAPIRERP